MPSKDFMESLLSPTSPIATAHSGMAYDELTDLYAELDGEQEEIVFEHIKRFTTESDYTVGSLFHSIIADRRIDEEIRSKAEWIAGKYNVIQAHHLNKPKVPKKPGR